jgi:hypothetical protein
MKNIHFGETEIQNVLDVVVAILNLGNVGFGTISAKGGDKVPSPSKGTSDFLISVGKLL